MRALLGAAALIGLLGTLAQAAEPQAACPDIDHDHAAWTAQLQEFLLPGARVDYGRWQRVGQLQLDAYLHMLAGVCPARYARWSAAQRIAFWVNAYNAYTVRLILENYPLTSIRDIGVLPGAAFRRRFIPFTALRGQSLSLDDIEHGILRSDFHEPRIHFALVCASRGCPPLADEAYRAADLDRQLDDRARAFVNDPTRNRFDRATRTLELSSIFKWYREDFERAAGSLPAYVARYLDAPADRAVRGPRVRIEFLPYDWRLNGE